MPYLVVQSDPTRPSPEQFSAALYAQRKASEGCDCDRMSAWRSFRGGNSFPNPVIQFRNPSRGTTATHCRVTNCAISSYSPAGTEDDTKWVSFYGTWNRLDHCAIEGKTNKGATVVVWRPDTTAQDHRIDRNYFGPRLVVRDNDAETIRVGTSDQSLSASRTVVEENLFDRCNGEIEIISNKSCENVYRYNTFIRCRGTLTLRHGNRCRVEGNFFVGFGEPGSGGIRIIGEDHVVVNNYVTATAGNGFRSALSLVNGVPNSLLNEYYQVKRAVVAFNTLAGNATAITIGAGASGTQTLPPANCVIASTIITGSRSPLVTFAAAPESLIWAGNLFWGASAGIAPLPASNQVADPLLGAPDTLGVRWLLAGSPAIDASAGVPAGLSPEADMDGQPRDQAPDIGADELSRAPVLRRPLARADVGPGSEGGTTGLRASGAGIPGMLTLRQNYPNPFNPSTTVPFVVGTRGRARLEVFDLRGHRVAVLFDGPAAPGRTYTARFEGSHLSTGVYYCKLTSSGSARVIRMMLLR